jgi:hypothetical protein
LSERRVFTARVRARARRDRDAARSLFARGDRRRARDASSRGRRRGRARRRASSRRGRARARERVSHGVASSCGAAREGSTADIDRGFCKPYILSIVESRPVRTAKHKSR